MCTVYGGMCGCVRCERWCGGERWWVGEGGETRPICSRKMGKKMTRWRRKRVRTTTITTATTTTTSSGRRRSGRVGRRSRQGTLPDDDDGGRSSKASPCPPCSAASTNHWRSVESSTKCCTSHPKPNTAPSWALANAGWGGWDDWDGCVDCDSWSWGVTEEAWAWRVRRVPATALQNHSCPSPCPGPSPGPDPARTRAEVGVGSTPTCFFFDPPMEDEEEDLRVWRRR